jgi:Fic family protein
MYRRNNTYLWGNSDWPQWRFEHEALIEPVNRINHLLGELIGRLQDVNQAQRDAMHLAALTDDVVKTSAIEGERLSVVSVRSSLARRLGVDIGALAPVDRHVEGVVEMVLDATGQCEQPLSKERLYGWHAALFPTGYSGLSPIQVGQWRNDAHGPMQVVSGPIGRERVHFEGPPANKLETEVTRFLEWLNTTSQEHALLKAGIGHLWFVTLHPFDDGNGRIARAIGDLLLARADGSSQRFYSLSAQIQHDRNAYYNILERTQKGGLDITEWLLWFLDTLFKSIAAAHKTLDGVLAKAGFWQHVAKVAMNERQTTMLNKLLDGFDGKLTTSKWAKISKCSMDTALCDINKLVDKNVLKEIIPRIGRASYELNLDAKS